MLLITSWDVGSVYQTPYPMLLITGLHSLDRFPGQEVLSPVYLEAHENFTGKRSHSTLFCLLFFFHLNVSQLFLSEELVFALFDYFYSKTVLWFWCQTEINWL